MHSIVEVPDHYEMEDSPELAVLTVLEHAALVARISLLGEHPAVGRLSDCYQGRLPPRQVLLAQIIVDRCSELADLIGWYRRACPHLLSNHPDKDDIAEGLPF